MNNKYTLKCFEIIDEWEELDSFMDEMCLYIRIKPCNKDENKLKNVRVNKYGWLQNYIKDLKYNSEDIINKQIYVIFNEQNEIECFGNDINSERIKEIITYQNGSEQSKITP